jgi:glutathione synthase/RimK-type ligase-like ATP-grasp enzyme
MEKNKMVLILTDELDVHADYVIEKLKSQKIPFFRFNLNVAALKNTLVSFKNGNWIIKNESGEISTEDVSCVWFRKAFIELLLEEKENPDVGFKIWRAEWNKTLLGIQNSLKNKPCLNPLRKAYKGENKFFQMDIAKEVGFEMPETLISNNKKHILDFIKKNEKCIFKLETQDCYRVGNEYKLLYSNVISASDIDKFEESGENPLIFQKYIEKQYEVRYTVVGKEHFVCKIESQKSKKANEDWRRYDISHTPHSPIEPPAEIKEKVKEMMKVLGIEYGALDFIVTPENKWIFLEINCFGQYLWIEELTGLKITEAIVSWLKNHI